MCVPWAWEMPLDRPRKYEMGALLLHATVALRSLPGDGYQQHPIGMFRAEPSIGRLAVPVENCRSFDLFSSSISETTWRAQSRRESHAARLFGWTLKAYAWGVKNMSTRMRCYAAASQKNTTTGWSRVLSLNLHQSHLVHSLSGTAHPLYMG